jgi:hypothetical protein
MQDSGGPYDYHLSRHLLRLGQERELPVRRDLFRYYYSDAHSAITAGYDTRTALLAFGCDATHGYERTHIDSLSTLSRVGVGDNKSPPRFARAAPPAHASRENINPPKEQDAPNEPHTPVPAVDTLVGQR